MRKEDYSYQFYPTTKEAWEAMYEAIAGAQKSIFWEIYIFEDDDIGKRFIDALAAKARRGIEIKLVIDAFGSRNFSRESERALTAAGIEVLKYNQLYPELKIFSWLHRLMNRNHRKVLIVDEETVFLGGVNVSDRFNSWDDVYLKIIGPVARPLLRGFAKSYLSAGGVRRNVSRLLHPKIKEWRAWREKLHFIVHSPTYYRTTLLRRLYIRGLATAQETVNLITPYYAPDKEFLRTVALARRRGVKINIFLPLRPDHKLTEIISRTYYELTVKAGANIYFLPNMNHAKAMSVDNNMGMVGSVNLTRRGSKYDEEAGVTFTDAAMVHDLNALFNNWRQNAKLFKGGLFKKPGYLARLQTWLAKRLEEFV